MRTVEASLSKLNYLGRNGGNVILYVLVCFLPEMFSVLSAVLITAGLSFVFNSAHLAVHHFAVYLVLGSLIKQTLTVTAMSTMAV